MKMATDLTTLPTSLAIFSHPSATLPLIRAAHKTLHTQLDATAARLRAQVGGSYRELLGTADTIVAMRADMDAVQTTLGRMGGRCGRTVVSRKVGGLGRFVEEEDTGLGAVARVRLLEGCVLGLERVLRGREEERLVLASKLWAFGRLLVKSFKGVEGADVKAAERSLDAGHRRLLRGIEGVLRRGGLEQDVLRALGAYSLATSSGARDVLRHFLRVRAQAMAMAFADKEEDGRTTGPGPKDVLRCLGLYTKTLQDVQSLVPHKLTEALVALKKVALLADESLRSMEGLRLDVHKRWCGDEIQYFTPFIRHDDLDVKQAKEMLTSWAKEGSGVLLRGLRKSLGGMVEFKAIVEMRTSILKLWVSEGGKARGFDPSILLDQIRAAINGHMLEVLEAKVTKLRLVGSEISAALDAWREGTTDRHQGLWEEDSFDTDLSNGAAQFTQGVVARLHGRNDIVSKAVTGYKSWYYVIDDVTTVVDQLRRQRWDNDIDEIEDEETIEHRQKLLAKEDPQKLSDHLNLSLIKAFKALDEHVSLLWNAHQRSPNNGAIAMYLLRVIRDIRARLPDELGAVKTFGLATVLPLHKSLASTVVVPPLEELATVALARKVVVGRSLWEGTPELPTSPSPSIFRFLRNLSMSMDDAGGDLWSPAAVTVLKQHLQGQISKLWLEAVEALASPTESGSPIEPEMSKELKAADDSGGDDVEEQPSPEKAVKEAGAQVEQPQDLFIQWLFDISYLGYFLESPAVDGKDQLTDLKTIVYQKTGLEGDSAKERLAKASQEYWKRTSLLFGLLT
ncbi:hypothetical protein B0T25DRAFT_604550 [Lasiosphaeria hispida]|uniref:Conserved oligomeric Golgi complex subunit 1 n=1 Tax=Lasiosphaeria hispida TaxID=260671 RepID=A0AAJ0MGL6_9PEZI|nr:hypothetical protein B0T25DRAFT_604550 [Lasiosphaeria hispida]